jgi:hypothetical protein
VSLLLLLFVVFSFTPRRKSVLLPSFFLRVVVAKVIDDQNDIIIALNDAKFPIRRRDIDISQTRLLRNAALLRVRELETSRSRARAGVPETNRGEIRRDDDGGDFRRDVSQPESCSRCVCVLCIGVVVVGIELFASSSFFFFVVLRVTKN